MRVDVKSAVVDTEAAWAAIGDTDWLNRVMGNGAVLGLDIQVDETGYPQIIGAMEGAFGARMTFEEDDNRWVAGRYFRQGRTYAHPLLKRSQFEARLEPEGAGVVASVSLELVGSPLMTPILSAAARRIRNRLFGHLHGLPAPGGAIQAPLRELPQVTLEAWDRWRRRVDPAVAEPLKEHLRRARPLELQRLRPFALADQWGLDRERVLSAMIHGVPEGLLELYWSVRCPRCHGQSTSTGHLGDLADHATCASCRIGFGADLGGNVEVLFAPHPSMGSRVDETFCSLFPLGAPETRASFLLARGEVHRDEVELQPGVFRIGSGGDRPDVRVVVGDGGRSGGVAWSPDAVGEIAVRPGPVALVLANGDARVRVTLTRSELDQDDRVYASTLTTMPQFRRELSDQVLAPDLRIATRSVTLLFTDLSGSTAMYEELGDAPAFAFIRDHFALLRRVIESHGGAIVKTIGDAVMAAFDEPARALAAGFEMTVALDAWTASLGLKQPPRLRVGLHVGPALVVHTDASGLDYFGRTVNIAARAQGVAGPGEVVWTEEVMGWASVRRAITERGLDSDTVEASLKGLAGSVRLHRARLAPPAPEASADAG